MRRCSHYSTPRTRPLCSSCYLPSPRVA
ncbi:hypothetical protein FJY70_00220 [candidate division WOR-3 bacterium]|nr:hypothetical protein [candidate division WOR-3 bacterium]